MASPSASSAFNNASLDQSYQRTSRVKISGDTAAMRANADVLKTTFLP